MRERERESISGSYEMQQVNIQTLQVNRLVVVEMTVKVKAAYSATGL